MQRLLALALLVALAWAFSMSSGLSAHLNKEDLQALVQGAGPWGMLLFLCLYCFGNFIYVPGVVFIVGSVLLYGYWAGMIVAFVGGLIAISTSFAIARKIGGAPLVKVHSPRLRALLSKLHHRPVLCMAAMRVFMQTSPALNTLLALSGVRYRDYLAAALLGMWVPVIVTATAFHYIVG